MTDSKEGRGYDRYTLPVVIEAPSLSDVALVPEDISAGGFSFVVDNPPDPGSVIDCTLMILDRTFKNSKAGIMWVRDNDAEPGTWLVGLSVQLSGQEREQFEKLLNQLLDEIS